MDSAPLKSALRVLNHVGGKTVFEKNSISAVGLNLMAKAQVKSGLEGFAVDTTRLASVVSHLGDQVSLSFGESLEIKSGRSKYTLATEPLPIQKFPELPTENFQLPMKPFQELLRFAANTSEKSNLYDYSGSIEIATVSGKLRATGTDGRVLVTANVETSAVLPAALLIPALAAPVLTTLDGDTVTVLHGESVLFFQSESITVGAKKLAKVFPDTTKLLDGSASRNRVVVFDSATLQQSLKILSPLLEEKVRVTLLADSMKLEAVENILGTAEHTLGIETIKPDALFDEVASVTFKINPKFLDFLAFCKGKVTLSVQDGSQPVFFSHLNKKALVATIR